MASIFNVTRGRKFYLPKKQHDILSIDYEPSKYLIIYVLNYFRSTENPFLISDSEFMELYRLTKVCEVGWYIIDKVDDSD